MQESNHILKSKEEVLDAVRRKKRMGVKAPTQNNNVAPQDDYKAFLEAYVFSKIGMTPNQLLGNLETQYSAEDDFRDRRQTNVEFVRGRHFGQMVWDNDLGRHITQFEYLKRRNMPPLTYNVVSKLVRSLVGQFREINTGNIVKCESKDSRGAELAHDLSVCVERIKKRGDSRSKDAMNCKEMLISGSPVFKVKWGSKNNMGKSDVMFRIVSRPNFMINPGVVDYDLDNLYRILEIHDTSLNDIITDFAGGDYERGMQIQEAYIRHQGSEAQKSSYSNQSFDGGAFSNRSFRYSGIGNSAYRYYEVWSLVSDYEAKVYDPLEGLGTTNTYKWRNPREIEKEVEATNLERAGWIEGTLPENEYKQQYSAEFVSRWYVTYITPWGMVLDVRESPYKSGLPPFVFPPPDINGEVWGIVEEVINAQLSLDRQILQADAIVGNASKGVWLVPDTAIPDTYTHKEYISQLKKTDGAIVYKVKDGFEDIVPKQLFANSANVSGNVQQLIQLYSNLIDEISGNYGAAQGRSDSSAKTATGYALESQNAGLNIRDIIENYLTLLKNRDELILRFVLEGYTKKDYEKILGYQIDPEEFKAFEFSIEQSKGTNSPSHIMALEQELLQMVYNELIPLDVFFDISNNPVMIQAKQKLDEYNKNKAMQQQEMANQQQKGRTSNPTEIESPDSMGMVQGTPQAGMLQDRGVEQQMRKLSKV